MWHFEKREQLRLNMWKHVTSGKWNTDWKTKVCLRPFEEIFNMQCRIVKGNCFLPQGQDKRRHAALSFICCHEKLVQKSVEERVNRHVRQWRQHHNNTQQHTTIHNNTQQHATIHTPVESLPVPLHSLFTRAKSFNNEKKQAWPWHENTTEKKNHLRCWPTECVIRVTTRVITRVFYQAAGKVQPWL